MADSRALTLRLDTKLKKQLDRLAQATGRSRSFLAAEAIREYVVLNKWQIREIKKGMLEADRGELAIDKEVEQALKKWTRQPMVIIKRGKPVAKLVPIEAAKPRKLLGSLEGILLPAKGDLTEPTVPLEDWDMLK